jgi:hypothetical protein
MPKSPALGENEEAFGWSAEGYLLEDPNISEAGRKPSDAV